ncbi:RDD family protein [Microbacterium terricola]|uniref:RDD domain-containing protein n=1 Tax=Microbacterium terricola TaxID=344163 RepID=A0ABM8DVM8_9MICO|nr:RDD family protein [Microbacterium terricola]UYK39562.1 RDD family protein [Microbacterium terricola]BDV29703.1 hypothetical protein Microterr_03630 [Microbacterium terricola]
MTEPATEVDEARHLGLVAAAPGIRSLAFAIDLTVAAVLATPIVIGAVLAAAEGESSALTVILVASGAAALVLFAVGQLLAHGRRGVTVGKAALRLRSVSALSYGRPGFWRVCLRALTLAASGLVPVVGPVVLLSSSLWDPQGRGRSILDRMVGCWLIDARAGLDPFDATALRRARRALRDRPEGLDEQLASMASGAPADASLRVPAERSRAGVVGAGETGAQWALAAELAVAPPIDHLPEPDLIGAPASAPTSAIPSSPGVARSASSVADAPDVATAVPDADVPPVRARRRVKGVLRFDDGTTARIGAFGLIGRDPVPGAGEEGALAIPLADPQRLMSKTHLAFGQDAEGLWVIDRGSRNGTQLLSPGGEVVEATPGERVRVPEGWVVQVGGRSFTAAKGDGE